jgi:hypothetical protein
MNPATAAARRSLKAKRYKQEDPRFILGPFSFLLNLTLSPYSHILASNLKTTKYSQETRRVKMELSVDLKRQKRDEGNFTRDDMAEYVRKTIAEGTPVSVLKTGEWVQVGDYQLMLTDTTESLDSAYARVVVEPDHPNWNWLLLPLAKFRDQRSLEEMKHARKKQVYNHRMENKWWVMDWCKCEDAKIVIYFWYVGDGSGAVVLAAPTI